MPLKALRGAFTVGRMNELVAYAAAQSQGMTIIAQCAGMSMKQLEDLGLPKPEAESLMQLHQTYFGRTSNSAKQAQARQSWHAIGTLRTIENYARRVKNINQAWDMRKQLCFTPAHKVDAVARRLLAEFRRPTKPVPGIRRAFHNGGLASLRIVAPAKDIQDVYGNVKDAPDPVAEFFRRFFDGGASRTQLTTNILIPLDDGIKILESHKSQAQHTAGQCSSTGSPADDVILQLTNGTTMSGTEFLQAALDGSGLADSGWATLVRPSGMPVYSGRTSRFANEIQRVMASAQNPTCAWDDSCTKPADECQVHHMVAYKHGGRTDPENLTMLCAFHNGRNDDDPDKPPRNGRMERIGGVPRRVFDLTKVQRQTDTTRAEIAKRDSTPNTGPPYSASSNTGPPHECGSNTGPPHEGGTNTGPPRAGLAGSGTAKSGVATTRSPL